MMIHYRGVQLPLLVCQSRNWHYFPTEENTREGGSQARDPVTVRTDAIIEVGVLPFLVERTR
jgi:hypothetical protein